MLRILIFYWFQDTTFPNYDFSSTSGTGELDLATTLLSWRNSQACLQWLRMMRPRKQRHWSKNGCKKKSSQTLITCLGSSTNWKKNIKILASCHLMDEIATSSCLLNLGNLGIHASLFIKQYEDKINFEAFLAAHDREQAILAVKKNCEPTRGQNGRS